MTTLVVIATDQGRTVKELGFTVSPIIVVGIVLILLLWLTVYLLKIK